MRSLPLVDGDEYQRQPVADRGCEALGLKRVGLAQGADALEEEPVGVADGRVARRVDWISQHRPVGLFVLLSRHEPRPPLRALGLGGVDQVLRVEAIELGRVVLRCHVPQRRQCHRQGDQALLAVDDAEIAKVVQGISVPSDGHHAANEVARHVTAGLADRVVLLDDVLPEIVLLVGTPPVVPLIERNPELPVLGHQLPERALPRLHWAKP